ncbi:MAG: DNA polymerase III subunit epsilon [Pseudomonadota bacterium]
MREIVFDTETTGLSAANGDRIVEIGCIELINRVETGKSFHCYFNPERAMDPAAQAIHGLSDIFLSDKPLFEDKVEDLLDFLDDSPLVAHNARFDFSFLNHELGACGRLHISESRMVDTLVLARARHPGAKHSLDALCSRFGIDRSLRVMHGALLDAQLLAQVYVELTGGRQIGLHLPTESKNNGFIDDTAKMGGDSTRKNAIQRPMRIFEPSAEELECHRAFLKKLTNPLWIDDVAALSSSANMVAIDEDVVAA